MLARTSLAAALLAASLLIPAAAAAPNDPVTTLSVTGVPTKVDARDGTVLVPMSVNVAMSNVACVPGPGTLTVALSSKMENATGGLNVTLPATLSFTVPNAAADFEASQPVNMVLRATSAAQAKVTIQATVASLEGCTGATTEGSSPPQTFDARLTPSGGGTLPVNTDVPVPGLELPLLLVALLGALLVVRRLLK